VNSQEKDMRENYKNWETIVKMKKIIIESKLSTIVLMYFITLHLYRITFIIVVLMISENDLIIRDKYDKIRIDCKWIEGFFEINIFI